MRIPAPALFLALVLPLSAAIASDVQIRYVRPGVGYRCVVSKEIESKGKVTSKGSGSMPIDRHEITRTECQILELGDRSKVTRGSLRFLAISGTRNDDLKGRELEYRPGKKGGVFHEDGSKLEDKSDHRFAMTHFRAISEKYSLSKYLAKQMLKKGRSISVPVQYIPEITGEEEVLPDSFKLRPRERTEIDGNPCLEFKVTMKGKYRAKRGSEYMRIDWSATGTYFVTLENGWPLRLELSLKKKTATDRITSESQETQKIEWEHGPAYAEKSDSADKPRPDDRDPEGEKPDDS